MIYESPDQGQTIYAREPHKFYVSDKEMERSMIKSPKPNSPLADHETYRMWQDILLQCESNEALQSAVNRVIMLYKLSNQGEI